ncbi:recombination regulator RecX [soil metagenome]
MGVRDGLGPAPREAMEPAGRLLARRARSEDELASRLAAAGHGDEAIAATLGRLRRLGLVDDRAFAREYVAGRLRRSARGSAALRTELARHGVAPAAADDAVNEAAGDEEQRAIELAVELAARLPEGLSLRVRAGRLGRRLAVRGFSEEVVESALRAALPPEGWD